MQMYLKSAGMSCFPILSSFLAALFFLFPNIMVAKGIEKEHFLDNFCHTPNADKKRQIENNKSVHHAPNDLEMIYERGTLRVLLQKKNDVCAISTIEKLLIEEFANIHNLGLDWVYVENNWELVTELMTGNGDIVIGQDQSLSTGVHSQINYTHAWTSANYKILQRIDDIQINRIQDLTGRHVAAYKASPIWDYLVELSKMQIGMILQEIPRHVSYQKTIERVKIGQYDLAVVDSLFLDQGLTSDHELQTSLSLSDERNMAWAVRSDAEELHKILNQYLNQQQQQ